MDLSKKVLLGSAIALFLSVTTYIIWFLAAMDGNHTGVKTAEVFVLIFALVALAASATTAFFMQRDAELDVINGTALGLLALVSILLIASSSLTIDIMNNPFGSGDKEKVATDIQLVSTIFSLPTIGIAGFAIAR